jgi:zinc finger MIZ domain-containing protein
VPVSGIPSPVLQRIIFTAILRRFWHQNGQLQVEGQQYFEQKAQDIFMQNQLDYLQRKAIRPVHANLAYDNEERSRDARKWGNTLMRLCEVHEQGLPLFLQNGQSNSPQNSEHIPEMSGALQSQLQPGPGRPRISDTTSPRYQRFVVPSPGAQVQRQDLRLLPPPGWVQPQQRLPHPVRFALHQAHLRSPILRAHPPDAMLYQHVVGFTKPPTRLTVRKMTL